MVREYLVAGFLFLLGFPANAALTAASPSCSQDTSKPASQINDSPSATSPTLPASTTKPKPKKVWTNDNVPDSGRGISVVGSSSSGSRSTSKTSSSSPPGGAGAVDPKIVASLRDQLQRLQAQLNLVEKQYSDLKAQSKGESKSAGGLQQNTFAYDSSSVEEQLRHLQEKKKRLEAAIEELLDAARKAGIEPGQLR